CCVCCKVHRVFLELVELLHCLGIQIFSVYEEDDFIDFRSFCQELTGFERGQCFTASCSVPDITVIFCFKCLFNQCFCRIYLVRSHDHQIMICFIQDHVTTDHFLQSAWCAEITQTFGEII